MRLDKLISNLKYGTRKEVKGFIKEHAITVNGEIATSPSMHINIDIDTIHIYGEELAYYKQLNIMLNKPVGYLSAKHDLMHAVAYELLDEESLRHDLKIAGRLDLESSGLLIFTTSGKLAHQITSPNTELSKVYEVILDKDIKDYNALLKGVIIKDGRGNDYKAIALDIKQIESNIVHITINTGKFHQVRRMFEAIGYIVTDLKRIQVGNLKLEDLPEGEFVSFKERDIFDWIYWTSLWLSRFIKGKS